MSRPLAIFLLVYFGTGVVLGGASVLLPYPIVNGARMGLYFYLMSMVVFIMGWPFIKGVRQALGGENPGQPARQESSVPPAMPARKPPGYVVWLKLICGIALLVSAILGITGEGQMAAGAFAMSLVVGVIIFALYFVRCVVEGYDEAIWEERFRTGCCLHCGYDLRGSGGTVCPECGENIREDYVRHPGSATDPRS